MNIQPIYVNIEEFENYCNIKILQLLYDKKFRFKLYTENNKVGNNLAEQKFNEGDVSYCENYISYSVVIEWLRLKYGIWINSEPHHQGKVWTSELRLIKQDKFIQGFGDFNSPQSAISAALDYILPTLKP